MTGMARRGVFPGSFNPLTIAHLEIAHLARRAHDLDEIHLVVSLAALGKPDPPGPALTDRIILIEADLELYDWLFVSSTELQLIADISDGYDVVIMGADKWEQVNDERYYESADARDAAIARLPRVAVARRTGAAVPDEHLLDSPESLWTVSSTEARAGNRALMAPKAAEQWR